MDYHLDVDGTPVRVRLSQQPDGTYRATVGEREVSVDFRPGHLLVEGRSVGYAVGLGPEGLPSEVLLQGRRIPVSIVSMGARTRQGRNGAVGAAGGRVAAPMNGQVVKVLCRQGEAVAAGQIVLILEAMKMENEVASPTSGVLETLAVAEGDSVHPADLLFVVSPPP